MQILNLWELQTTEKLSPILIVHYFLVILPKNNNAILPAPRMTHHNHQKITREFSWFIWNGGLAEIGYPSPLVIAKKVFELVLSTAGTGT